jgi:hypothetical protein
MPSYFWCDIFNFLVNLKEDFIILSSEETLSLPMFQVNINF